MIVVPENDNTFTAVCDRCDQTFNLSGEEILGVMARQHESKHEEEDRLATAMTRAAALEPRDFRSLHVHGLACTYEVCGVGPRRADLIAMSRARR